MFCLHKSKVYIAIDPLQELALSREMATSRWTVETSEAAQLPSRHLTYFSSWPCCFRPQILHQGFSTSDSPGQSGGAKSEVATTSSSFLCASAQKIQSLYVFQHC